VTDRSLAELIIVNTCTVTEAADREGRRFVRRLVEEHGPGRVVVTGCSSQRDPGLYAATPGVRLVTGNTDKERLPQLLVETAGEIARGVPVRVAPALGTRPISRLRSLQTNGHSENARAYVRVQDGCNQQCTFCTLPGVRGTSASVPLATVIEQARHLAGACYGELVLTGAHLGSYGYDLTPRVPLDALITAVLAAAPSCRLRLSSLEPRFVSRGLLKLFRSEPRLCPHLHLPLQSGDDRVLAGMRRAYRSGSFERRALAARDAVRERLGPGSPGMALGSDFIVGFPGEDDEAFAATMQMVERLPFTYGHVFPYSNRPGTPAAELPDQIPGEHIKRRSAALRSLLRHRREDFRRRHLGREVEIVVEGVEMATGETGTYHVTGTSESYLTVRARGSGRPPEPRMRLAVQIDGVEEEVLVGEISKSEGAPQQEPGGIR
jgi:threonylcarbamoyladenosine tRNA methylthiotransferase MtaB